MNIEVNIDTNMLTFTHNGAAITVDLRTDEDIMRTYCALKEAAYQCKRVRRFVKPTPPVSRKERPHNER
jgi:hypothetical protein